MVPELEQPSTLIDPQPVIASPTIALIPAFNEARFIGSLVLAARSFVDHVVVVDDGSSDQTVAIALKAGATVLEHQHNQGKAAAINTGLVFARQQRPRAVVMLDGDGQHAASDIPAVLAPIQAGTVDVVIGSRFLAVKSAIPAYRQVGQHGLTLITNLASGVHLTNSQSGFRAFSQQALEHMRFTQEGFSIKSEMQFLIRQHALRLAEVPITVLYAEPAKRNPVWHGLQVVNGILNLMGQTRPLLFVSVPGAAMLVLGALIGLHVTSIYLQTHILAIGYALITILLVMTGMLLLFVGVILHSMRAMLLDLQTKLLRDRAPAAAHTIKEIC